MWYRLTTRTKNAVCFAQTEAQRLGVKEVGPEHLLLGLMRENDHVAARVLKCLGISRRRVRSEIEREVVHGSDASGQDMKISPAVQRVLNSSYEEAARVNRGYAIGTEH